MISFASPWTFLLVLPWLAACWRVWRTARTKGVIFASASTRFATVKPSWRQWCCALLPAVFLVGVLCLIIGAAGPRTQLARDVRASDALAVMMTVDISGSMSGLDLSEGRDDVTRLDVVKQMFHTFVERRPDDLIGLVTFGGYASVRAPLTADHRALLHTLSGVRIPGAQGDTDERGRRYTGDEAQTAIGDGLAVSLLRLKDALPKTKIVILLSDGENNAGAVTPLEAAKAAAELGVRVYTVGVGTTGVAKARGRDLWGRTVIHNMWMTLDEGTLKQIAALTGGEYANVREPEQLEAFLEHISELETTRVERQVYTRYASHARLWLMLGGLCCLLSAGLLMKWLRRPV